MGPINVGKFSDHNFTLFEFIRVINIINNSYYTFTFPNGDWNAFKLAIAIDIVIFN